MSAKNRGIGLIGQDYEPGPAKEILGGLLEILSGVLEVVFEVIFG